MVSLPMPGPREDRLGDDRAREQERDLEPDVRDDGQQRVAQRVLEVDDARREALGLGRPHVVLAERLEHARPDEPAVTRDVDHDQRDDRQDQVLADVDEGRSSGCWPKYSQYWSEPNGGDRRVSVMPLAGSTVQRAREDEDQHDAQPERGHREPDVAEHGRRRCRTASSGGSRRTRRWTIATESQHDERDAREDERRQRGPRDAVARPSRRS